jgi:diguanylate cyclase (GGDEF)-like protein/PAS domain S-box-containing protein
MKVSRPHRSLCTVWRANPLYNGSLAARLFLIGFSTSVLSVLLTAGGYLTYELLQFRTTLTSNLKSVADILSVNNTAPLNFGDPQVARENLSALKADPHMLGACLYDRSGKLFASYARDGSYHACPVTPKTVSGLSFDQGHASYSVPVHLDNETLGTLFLCHGLEDEYARVKRSLLMLAAVLAGVLLFATWLSLRMSRAIARPIEALVGISRDVSERRDYSLRVTLDSDPEHGELGLLIDSFNHMLSKVEEGDDELSRHREHLEDEVTARTVDLMRLNRELTAELHGRRTAESALRESEERYALAMNGANDGLWDWDLKSGRVYYSSRWKAMLGCSEEEIGDQPAEWLDRAHPGDADRLRSEIEAHWHGRTSEFRIECRMRHRDGSYRWMLSRGLAIRSGDGKVTRMAGSQTDITDAKVSDPLTGLANRILFTESLARCIEQNHRDPERIFAVLFLDLDRFKVINDSLGHLAGDQLLVGVSQRLCQSVRSWDLCTTARMGGDEFAVLLENIQSEENARRVADRIQRDCRLPFVLEGRSVFTTFSIGVALSNKSYQSPEEILRDADTAMYAAKGSGKAHYEVFDAAMRARAVTRLEIETDLRRALTAHELVIHYQPEVNLDTGEIVALEALVRWQHPRHGIIPPLKFIPIAEETGLIVPLGAWVLKEACSQMRLWHSAFPNLSDVRISVNISGKQFVSKDLLRDVEQALRVSGLPPECLDLEITESVLMDDTEGAIQTLLDLKALGIGLQIDDFGTGYSSLSYLHRLPFDTLKIDRAFVSPLGLRDGRHEDGLEIIWTIMTLAQSLRMRVIAEGIETGTQLSELRQAGCEFGQGYHFSKPLDAAAAEKLLAERSGTLSHLPELAPTG